MGLFSDIHTNFSGIMPSSGLMKDAASVAGASMGGYGGNNAFTANNYQGMGFAPGPQIGGIPQGQKSNYLDASFAGQNNIEYRQYGGYNWGPGYRQDIPTEGGGSRIIPVVATRSGADYGNMRFPLGSPEAAQLNEDRAGGAPGITVQNSKEQWNTGPLPGAPRGITSTWQTGQMDPTRTQLFGRLGTTPTMSLLLHPELQQSLPGMGGLKGHEGQISPGYSMINARAEPAYGSAEGARYAETLANEEMGANMVYDPLRGDWGSRNFSRGFLNAAIRNRALGSSPTPTFEGYSPNDAWKQRLKHGVAQEHMNSINSPSPTIQTYEGKQNI